MIGSLAASSIALGAIIGGTAATYVDPRPTLTARLAMGACLGFALLGIIALPLASLFGLTPVTTALAALAAVSPSLILLRKETRDRLRADVRAAAFAAREALAGRDRHALAAFALFLVFSVLVLGAFRQAMLQNDEGIQTRAFANRKDLALHLGIISGFAWGDNYPPEHPEFARAPLTYPFLIDFVAAIFVEAGASFEQALFLQNAVLVIALIVLIYHWSRELTGSRLAALFSPLLVLVGSGLGWLVMLRDFRAAGVGPLEFLTHLPHSYTLNTANLQWGNLVTIFLVPTRSALLGLPLALIVTLLWWRVTQESAGPIDRRRMILAGIVAGLVPLANTHSFGVLLLAGAGLALLFPRWRLWFLFFAVMALVAVPQLWWIARQSTVPASAFFAWDPGWSKGPEPLLWFWFKNTGLFIPLLLLALAAPSDWVSPALRRFYLPFLLFFIIPNLFRLYPQIWGNNKVLIYWYIGSVPLVAALLAGLWRRGPVLRLCALGLIASISLSGLLDVWRVAWGTVTVTLFDRGAIEFASAILDRTPPRALIVRGLTLDHPVLLTGRRSVLGYVSRVKSHGLDSATREAEIRCVYAGCPDARALLDRYGVDYVVVGPPERREFPMNEAFLQQFPVVAAAGGYELRRARSEQASRISKR